MTKRTSASHAALGTTRGSLTRQAIRQFDALAARVAAEFEDEHCVQNQMEVRPALISLFKTTVNVAVHDAERLTDTLPAEAVAALDRAFADLRVLELTDAVLNSDDDGVKEKAISLVKLLLPLIPKQYEWVRKLIEVILELIELLQKNK